MAAPRTAGRHRLQQTGGTLHYWQTPSGSEVDFIWTRGTRAVGIEVKASRRWRSEYGAALKALLAEWTIQAGFGVYTGAAEFRDGPLRVLPLRTFSKPWRPATCSRRPCGRDLDSMANATWCACRSALEIRERMAEHEDQPHRLIIVTLLAESIHDAQASLTIGAMNAVSQRLRPEVC